MRIKVLIVDDHALFRQGLRALLEIDGQFEVVGEAERGDQACGMAACLEPDIVLMDIAMRDMDGMTAAKRILDVMPEARIVFLTQYENKEYILPAIRLGAAGYILKRSAADVTVKAIKRVYEGDFYIDPEIAAVVVDAYRGSDAGEGYGSLTDREREILVLLAKDKTNKEVASILSISAKTVDYHRSNLMRKLDIHSKVELTKFAIRNGLIDA